MCGTVGVHIALLVYQQSEVSEEMSTFCAVTIKHILRCPDLFGLGLCANIYFGSGPTCRTGLVYWLVLASLRV